MVRVTQNHPLGGGLGGKAVASWVRSVLRQGGYPEPLRGGVREENGG